MWPLTTNVAKENYDNVKSNYELKHKWKLNPLFYTQYWQCERTSIEQIISRGGNKMYFECWDKWTVCQAMKGSTVTSIYNGSQLWESNNENRKRMHSFTLLLQLHKDQIKTIKFIFFLRII